MLETIELKKTYIEKAVRHLQDYDPDWQPEFCENCAFLRVYGATATDPGGMDCICGLDPLDEQCWQSSILLEDERVIQEAEEYAMEDMPEVMPLSSIDASCIKMQSNLDEAATNIVGFFDLVVATLEYEREDRS